MALLCASVFQNHVYRLLQLADPPQRRPVLLRVGDSAVAAVPPQLIAEVLHAVSLSLRTDFTLGE